MRVISSEDEFDHALDRVELALRKLEAFTDEDDSMEAQAARERYSLALLFYRSIELRLRAAALKSLRQSLPLLIYSAGGIYGRSLKALTRAWGYESGLVDTIGGIYSATAENCRLCVVAVVQTTELSAGFCKSLIQAAATCPVLVIARNAATAGTRRNAVLAKFSPSLKLITLADLRDELKQLQPDERAQSEGAPVQ